MKSKIKTLKIGSKLQIAEIGSIVGLAMRPKLYKATVVGLGPNWFKVKYQHTKNEMGECFSEITFNSVGQSRSNERSHWDVKVWNMK